MENKGADQLCSYCTADLHRQNFGFHMMQLILAMGYKNQSFSFLLNLTQCMLYGHTQKKYTDGQKKRYICYFKKFV